MTSTGKGRRGALIPAAAAAALAIAGTALAFGPNGGSPSPTSDSQVSQSLAQSSSLAPTPSPTPAAGQGAAIEPAPSDPGSGAEEAAGEPAPTYPPGQEPWRPVLTGFATDFAQPTSDWSVRVVRWTSEYLADEYAQMSPDRVQAAELRDIEVVAAGEGAVDAVAVYDTGFRLIMRAENSIEGWKITKVEPAE